MTIRTRLPRVPRARARHLAKPRQIRRRGHRNRRPRRQAARDARARGRPPGAGEASCGRRPGGLPRVQQAGPRIAWRGCALLRGCRLSRAVAIRAVPGSATLGGERIAGCEQQHARINGRQMECCEQFYTTTQFTSTKYFSCLTLEHSRQDCSSSSPNSQEAHCKPHCRRPGLNSSEE